ncbi:DUF4159 domain-containing protein [bacterium]|nr:DUF4159 domain-containing protein [bacterium]
MKNTKSIKYIVLSCLAGWLFFMAFPMPSQAQYRRQRVEPNLTRDIFPSHEFTFCRVQYAAWRRGRFGMRGGSWATDFPDSDLNFSQRLSELTAIEVNRDEDGKIEHAVVRLTDPALFNYPFIYMLEVAGLSFTEQEIKHLRSYLLRGGFLLVDDFWGMRAWQNFAYEIGRVLPPDEYPIVELPTDHPIFHIVFKIDEVPQIPGIGMWFRTGSTTEVWDEPDPGVHFRGIFDKQGRLMVIINHNSDLGDGWEEEAVNPVYFEEFSARKAYPLGINIVVYAMTH